MTSGFTFLLRLELLFHRVLSRKTGNSVGGVVEAVVRNVPAGLGSPVFDKLEADLAKGCMSLPASKGFEVFISPLYQKR